MMDIIIGAVVVVLFFAGVAFVAWWTARRMFGE